MAALHLYFLVLEMFLWKKPFGRKTFGLTREMAEATASLAANQGLYNGFLAAGLVWGLSLGAAGFSIKVFFLVCVVGLALQGGRPDFGRDVFAKLKDREGFDASWPVYAACHVQWIWAASEPVRLGSFLRETDLFSAAEDTILAIRERRDTYIDVFEIEELSREHAAECLEIALWEP